MVFRNALVFLYSLYLTERKNYCIRRTPDILKRKKELQQNQSDEFFEQWAPAALDPANYKEQ